MLQGKVKLNGKGIATLQWIRPLLVNENLFNFTTSVRKCLQRICYDRNGIFSVEVSLWKIPNQPLDILCWSRYVWSFRERLVFPRILKFVENIFNTSGFSNVGSEFQIWSAAYTAKYMYLSCKDDRYWGLGVWAYIKTICWIITSRSLQVKTLRLNRKVFW